MCKTCINRIDLFKCKSCVEGSYYECKFKVGDEVKIIGPSTVFTTKELNEKIDGGKVKVINIDNEKVRVLCNDSFLCILPLTNIELL